jgi:pilus assembly protein CpaE
MTRLRTAIFTTDLEQLSALQSRVNRTICAHSVFAHTQAAGVLADSVLQEARALDPDLALVSLGREQAAERVGCIERLREALPHSAVLAVGPMDPRLIVAAMRAGAREYLDENFSDSNLLDAFSRMAASHEQARVDRAGRAKLFAVFSAKGGSGGTTVAINLAMALQERVQSVAVVDLATLGHTPLHLDARPVFGLMDAVQNLHRLDRSLLESFMVSCQGVRLLAGPGYPGVDFPAEDVGRVLEVLAANYRAVVVDCSTRCDAAARIVFQRCESALLVAQTDAISLWSAARIREFLVDGSDADKLSLVVNRFRATPPLPEKEIEATTQMPIACKVPNQFQLVAKAIDRGSPAGLGNSDLARCFRELAAQLLPGSAPVLAHREAKGERPNRILERLLNLSPAR